MQVIPEERHVHLSVRVAYVHDAHPTLGVRALHREAHQATQQVGVHEKHPNAQLHRHRKHCFVDFELHAAYHVRPTVQRRSIRFLVIAFTLVLVLVRGCRRRQLDPHVVSDVVPDDLDHFVQPILQILAQRVLDGPVAQTQELLGDFVHDAATSWLDGRECVCDDSRLGKALEVRPADGRG